MNLKIEFVVCNCGEKAEIVTLGEKEIARRCLACGIKQRIDKDILKDKINRE